MTFRERAPYVIITIIIFFGLTFLLSQKFPFSGDEFYTLDIDKIHKPIPYQYFTKWHLGLLSIEPSSIFLIRISSILFSVIGICLFLFHVPCNLRALRIACLLILSNSFLLRESIFFRYYSFYFLCSVIILIVLLFRFEIFSQIKKIGFSLIGVLVSPFIFYILNSLQFGFYLLFILISHPLISSRIRIVLVGLILTCTSIIVINPKLIWELMGVLNLSGHANVELPSIEIRGFSLSILIKPLYAIYQMFFGYDIAPTESILSLLGFPIICMGIIYFLWVYYDKNGIHELLKIIFTFIVPFLIVYLFFEPLSLPGFTQLEPKHGMMIFPFLLYIVTNSISLFPKKYFFPFLIIVFSSQLTGMYYTFQKQHTDWPKIVKNIKEHTNNNDSKIIMDGRSRSVYEFYNIETKYDVPISYTWSDIGTILHSSVSKNKIALLLNDYKSYTPLSLKQNWNSGMSSQPRVYGLNSIISELNREYMITDSYVLYPTFLYILNKKDRPDNVRSFDVWQHQLKDLHLPAIGLDDKIILSSIMIQPGDSATIRGDSILVLNLENSSDLKTGVIVGEFVGGTNQLLKKGENIWDLYSDYYNEVVDVNKIYYSWHHLPLVSGSINYNGSYFKHKANIYWVKLSINNQNPIKLINQSPSSRIRLWLTKDQG